MTVRDTKILRFVVIAVLVLVIVTAANALIDFGALLHNLTHSH